MMVVKMEEGYDRVRASAYAWSHTAAPMLRHPGYRRRLHAQRLRPPTAGEYTSNMFWIVGIALIASWLVAVIFTPYFGVKLLPEIKKVEGGHDAIYDTPRYNHFRRILGKVIAHKWLVAGSVIGLFVTAVLGMALVKKQFFPISDRPEVMVEVQMPYGTSILQTSAAAESRSLAGPAGRGEDRHGVLGQGAPRFFMAMSPGTAGSVVRQDRRTHRQPG